MLYTQKGVGGGEYGEKANLKIEEALKTHTHTHTHTHLPNTISQNCREALPASCITVTVYSAVLSLFSVMMVKLALVGVAVVM